MTLNRLLLGPIFGRLNDLKQDAHWKDEAVSHILSQLQDALISSDQESKSGPRTVTLIQDGFGYEMSLLPAGCGEELQRFYAAVTRTLDIALIIPLETQKNPDQAKVLFYGATDDVLVARYGIESFLALYRRCEINESKRLKETGALEDKIKEARIAYFKGFLHDMTNAFLNIIDKRKSALNPMGVDIPDLNKYMDHFIKTTQGGNASAIQSTEI